MPQGRQVEVEEQEEILARVAAIDVGKASGMVCTRVPHQAKAGARVTTVWDVAATTSAIMELADRLVCQGIQRVVVESTSDYWRPVVYLLQAHGLLVWLVNARDVKQVPGRPKTRVAERSCEQTWRRISRETSRLQQITLAGEAGTIVQTTPLRPTQRAIYQALSIDPPPRVSAFDPT